MPLPVAHGLVGASISAVLDGGGGRRWRRILFAAAIANLPDADFFFVWVLGMGSS